MAGCVDKGVVTQDNTTINDGNDSLDAGYMTDTDPDVRAGTIAAMRRADEILVANGRGSRDERAAERIRRFEDELNWNGFSSGKLSFGVSSWQKQRPGPFSSA